MSLVYKIQEFGCVHDKPHKAYDVLHAGNHVQRKLLNGFTPSFVVMTQKLHILMTQGAAVCNHVRHC